ncbi:LPD1 domain-containing protein [Vreelandella vilamensis]|uniref:LPD1 domain-containing protein n=1 Tax=Vreelandella vilamensis TaxID=531309 RepID=UPI00286C4902|nr:LPD1 domain-containing protein [Halomonas vilamensis]
MSAKAFRHAAPFQFASSAWLEGALQKPHTLNQQLADCLKAVFLTDDGTGPSKLFEASQKADNQLKVLYYARPEELCARAFEAFVEDCQPGNHFLVNGTIHSDEAHAGLYPQGWQRQQISEAFESYFSALGEALYREQEKTR